MVETPPLNTAKMTFDLPSPEMTAPMTDGEGEVGIGGHLVIGGGGRPHVAPYSYTPIPKSLTYGYSCLVVTNRLTK